MKKRLFAVLMTLVMTLNLSIVAFGSPYDGGPEELCNCATYYEIDPSGAGVGPPPDPL